jgi:hypothetical protein
MGELESTRGARMRPSAGARQIGLTVVILAALIACDSGRNGVEPIAECTAYAASAELCFGGRVATRLRASFAKPPADEASRSALRTQCAEGNATIRRSCR